MLMAKPATNVLVFAPSSETLGARRSMALMQRSLQQDMAKLAAPAKQPSSAASSESDAKGEPVNAQNHKAEQAVAALASKGAFRAVLVHLVPDMAMMALRSNKGGVLEKLEVAVRQAVAQDATLQQRLTAVRQVR
jgi:hypothetical protein